ncbi:MAG: DUF4388 domain-containing protein [Acidimicrobiia bacterium]
MSLIGTVDTLALSDLFEVLARADKTGALHVRSQQGLGIVYFDAGKLSAGEAGHRSGPVEDRPELVARLFEVCFELFRFEEASFEFELDGQPGWAAPDSVEVAEVLAETARRMDEWARIRVLVPSLEARPRLVPGCATNGVKLDAAQWRVVAGIDGRRRVTALIRVLDGSDFEICRHLAGLVESGLVALDASDAAPIRSEPLDGEILEEFRLESRRSTNLPSRLAAVLEDDPAPSDEDGPDEVAMWDEQVLATS